jgi:hypothetical protein
MNTNAIYEETLTSSMMKLVIALMGAITITFLVFYIIQVDNSPSWYWLMMFLIFAVVTAFVTNFGNLTIMITSSTITVRYGMLKSIIQWGNVEKCTYDKDSSFGYGGFGLRIARGHSTWIRAYNLMIRQRVALDLKTGKSKRIVFSTDNPDQIMEIAKQQGISTY